MSGPPPGWTPTANAPPPGWAPVAGPSPAPTPPKPQPSATPIVNATPSVDAVGDFNTDWQAFGKGGIRPEFRSYVQNLTAGNRYKLGVYDFDKGHHFAANDPHLDGRAMDVDSVNGENVGDTPTTGMVKFVNDALAANPNVRLGLHGSLYKYFAAIAPGRVFSDAPAHIHVELDAGSVGNATKPPTGWTTVPPQAGMLRAANPNVPTPNTSQMPPIYTQMQKAVQAVWNETTNSAGKTLGTAGNEWLYYHDHPLEGLDAILGALQRGAAGSEVGRAGMSPFPDIGKGMYAAFHPRDHAFQEQLLSDTIAMFGFNPKDTGWKRLGEALLGQTISDPLTYLGGLGMLTKGAKAVTLIDTMNEALKGAEAVPQLGRIFSAVRGSVTPIAKPFYDAAHWILGQRPELEEFLDDGAKAARLGIEHRSLHDIAPMAEADAKVLADNLPELQNVAHELGVGYNTPQAVVRHLLQYAHDFGNQEMRSSALRQAFIRGITLAKGPEQAVGALNYDVRKVISMLTDPEEGQTFAGIVKAMSGGRFTGREAGFDLPRVAKGVATEAQDAIASAMMNTNRELIRRFHVDTDTLNYLEHYGGWKGPGPIDVSQLSHRANEMLPGFLQNSPLRAVSELSREAVMAIPIPHVSNIMQLAWLRGGPVAFAKGLQYAIKGLSDSQVARLVNMGAHADYMRELIGPWKNIPGVKNLVGLSNSVLSRVEGGYRQAILDQLDHEWGELTDASTEFRKGQEIRDSLGDYRNVNAFVQALKAFGGPFLAFRLNIVPRAVNKALTQRPWNVESIARTIHDINQPEVIGPDKEFHLGGSLEDYERLVSQPEKSLTSPSTIGPASTAASIGFELAAHRQPNLGAHALELARGYTGPLTGTAMSALGLPYPEPGSKAGQVNLRQALLSVFGAYLSKPIAERLVPP